VGGSICGVSHVDKEQESVPFTEIMGSLPREASGPGGVLRSVSRAGLSVDKTRRGKGTYKVRGHKGGCKSGVGMTYSI